MSTAIVLYEQDHQPELAYWFDNLMSQPVTSYQQLVVVEREIYCLAEHASLIQEDLHPNHVFSPAALVSVHAANLRLADIGTRTAAMWLNPQIRLSAQYGSLSRWQQFFTGDPDWEPVLFVCGQYLSDDDPVREFARTSTVSPSPRWSPTTKDWRDALIAPRWFHQMLSTAVSLTVPALTSRILLPRYTGVHTTLNTGFVGAALPVPSPDVLSFAFSLWDASDPQLSFTTLEAAISAAVAL